MYIYFIIIYVYFIELNRRLEILISLHKDWQNVSTYGFRRFLDHHCCMEGALFVVSFISTTVFLSVSVFYLLQSEQILSNSIGFHYCRYNEMFVPSAQMSFPILYRKRVFSIKYFNWITSRPTIKSWCLSSCVIL